MLVKKKKINHPKKKMKNLLNLGAGTLMEALRKKKKVIAVINEGNPKKKKQMFNFQIKIFFVLKRFDG